MRGPVSWVDTGCPLYGAGGPASAAVERAPGRRRSIVSAGPTPLYDPGRVPFDRSTTAEATAKATTTLARIVGLVAALAMASPPPVQAAAPAPGPDVGTMWRDANAKLGTGDYAAAIDELTRVFEQIATDPDARTLRMRVRMALHDAHRGAHRIDGNTEHLAVAREVLQNGLGEFGPDDAEMRASAEAAIATLDAELAEAEAVRERERQAEAARAAEAARVEPPPPVVSPNADPIDAPYPDDGDARRRRTRWIAVAGAGAGVGALGLALVAGGFGSANAAVGVFEDDPERRDLARTRIRRGNTLGIAGAVVAAVGLVTVAVALPMARRARRAGSRDVAWSVGPTRRGLALRF